MTPFASVAMLEKLALLKIALCRASGKRPRLSQCANQIRGLVRFTQAHLTIDVCQAHMAYIRRRIENARAATRIEPGGDIRAASPVG
jgi:hypothetical protein